MLNGTQRLTIENTIRTILRRKFATYTPETSNMPFHLRLLGRDRMALYSFIHSLNTSFGTSIFEPVAETLANLKFVSATKQYQVGDRISTAAQEVIQEIINNLSTGMKNPDKPREIEKIRRVCTKGKLSRIKTVRADLCVIEQTGSIHLFDIKTAKPNISNFKDFKRTLLEWIAIYLTQHPDATVNSYIAIPYNPYEPEPYQRWTLRGMIDINNELMVAQEFWDFLGGKGAYKEILDCFERVGIELRPEIDAYFSRFK